MTTSRSRTNVASVIVRLAPGQTAPLQPLPRVQAPLVEPRRAVLASASELSELFDLIAQAHARASRPTSA